MAVARGTVRNRENQRIESQGDSPPSVGTTGAKARIFVQGSYSDTGSPLADGSTAFPHREFRSNQFYQSRAFEEFAITLVTLCLGDEVCLTEKLPNVNTCPSMSSTAVWLLPAVT